MGFIRSFVKNRFAFTLIELITVIAVVGILMSVAVISMAGYRERTRDARRKHDLAVIGEAFEAWKLNKVCSEPADVGKYPGGSIEGTQTCNSNPIGGNGQWVNVGCLIAYKNSCGRFVDYLPDIPNDPLVGSLPDGIDENGSEKSPEGMQAPTSRISRLEAVFNQLLKLASAQGSGTHFEWLQSNTYNYNLSADRLHYRLSSILERGEDVFGADCDNDSKCKAAKVQYDHENDDWKNFFSGKDYGDSTSQMDKDSQKIKHTYFIGN